MRSIILAAGRGTRLGSDYSNTPKSLIELGGKRILERQIEVLQTSQVTETILVTGFEAEKFEFLEYPQVYNPRFTETNMVYSLSLALDNLDCKNTIVSYGDVLFSPASLSKLAASKSDFAILSDVNWYSYWNERSSSPLNDLETFAYTSNNQLIDIGSRANSFDQIMGQFIGVVYLSETGIKKVSSIIKRSENDRVINRRHINAAFMTDLLMELINGGEFIEVIPFSDPWIEIDTVLDLQPEIINWRYEFIETQCTLWNHQ
jgi:choline kinase